MRDLATFTLNKAEIDKLKSHLLESSDVLLFSEQTAYASLVASLGMMREVGTQNDEIARFLFEPYKNSPIKRKSLRSELVRFKDEVGVRIWSEQSSRIELRFPGIRPLLDPRFSFDDNGDVKQLVVFPKTIKRFLESQGVEPVIVKSWALNTIFGNFHPAMNYYQTNLWELTNIDTIRFAKLVGARQVPVLGTHDFIAHIAGTDGERWSNLQERGRFLTELLNEYFSKTATPSLSSLILPYVAGVLLDDLAQPSSYDDVTRLIPLELINNEIQNNTIRPEERRILSIFPSHYEKLINLARFKTLDEVKLNAKQMVKQLVAEILGASVVV